MDPESKTGQYGDRGRDGREDVSVDPKLSLPAKPPANLVIFILYLGCNFLPQLVLRGVLGRFEYCVNCSLNDVISHGYLEFAV